MGLFSGTAKQAQSANLAEVFPPGTPFWLISGEAQLVDDRLQAVVRCAPATESERQADYGVWGTLAQQITQVEPGELPAIVTMSDQSGAWQFVPHGPAPVEVSDPNTGEVSQQPQRVAPEAHMLPDGATDAPNPVPQASAPPPPPVPEGGHRNPPPGDQPPSVHPTAIDDSGTFQPGAGAQ